MFAGGRLGGPEALMIAAAKIDADAAATAAKVISFTKTPEARS